MSKEVSASGFVAGTLVHTDKGLVPIEQLKVGDMVLSKHESGEGEQTYKRVISTFKSAEKMPIVRVSFGGSKGEDGRSGDSFLFCTDNHPFWSCQKKSWILAGDIQDQRYQTEYLTDIYDNPITIKDDTGYLLETSITDIAVCSEYYACKKDNDGYGMVVDFRQNRPLLVGGGGISWQGSYSDQTNWHRDEEVILLSEDIIYRKDGNAEVKFYKDAIRNIGSLPYYIDKEIDVELKQVYRNYVYNIEVEDFHTYYVGKAGIWVHNSNTCLNLGVFPSTPKVTQP